MCKELQLPSSEYNYTADLVAVTSAATLETAPIQSISILAVAAEGTARFWPSLAQEGNYTETDVDLGDLCNFVVAVRVSKSSINHIYVSGYLTQLAFCVLFAPSALIKHSFSRFSTLSLRVGASSCPQPRVGC